MPSVPIAAAPVAVPVQRSTSGSRSGPGAFFGWKNIDGTVIHEAPQHLSYVRKEWWEIVLRLLFIAALIVVFGTTAIVILVVAAIFALLFSRRGGQRSQGFLSSIATQMTSFFLFSRLFGPKATVPVRDYRVRDQAGAERLVRIEGHITHGTIVVGDEISVGGFDHQGTLVFRRGWNKRLNCAVRVRRS